MKCLLDWREAYKGHAQLVNQYHSAQWAN